MLYLNGGTTICRRFGLYHRFLWYLGFKGGCTNFLEGVPGDLLQVPPESGLLLVFQHNILHEGEELKSDRKYIMRSDVVYQQDPKKAKYNKKEKEKKKDRKNN